MNISASAAQSPANSAKRTISVIGFGRRLVANLLDGLVIGIFTFILTTLVGSIAVFLGVFNPDASAPFNPLLLAWVWKPWQRS